MVQEMAELDARRERVKLNVARRRFQIHNTFFTRYLSFSMFEHLFFIAFADPFCKQFMTFGT